MWTGLRTARHTLEVEGLPQNCGDLCLARTEVSVGHKDLLRDSPRGGEWLRMGAAGQLLPGAALDTRIFQRGSHRRPGGHVAPSVSSPSREARLGTAKPSCTLI